VFRVSDLVKASGGCLGGGRETMVLSGISSDSRTLTRNAAFIALRGENFDGHDFIAQALKKGAKCIIHESKPVRRAPGVAYIRVKNTIKALGDIARAHRMKFDIPVIAVVGSNGKTTAKDMAARVLSAKYKVLKSPDTENNHIGVPHTLLRLTRRHEAAVIEIGTNHFGEIAYLAGIASPTVGIITNIGPAHLKYLKSLNGVYKEKTSLLDNLRSPGIAILNADDPKLSPLLRAKRGRNILIGIGMERAADFRASLLEGSPLSSRIRVNNSAPIALNLPGGFNVYNALFAIACGRILGLRYNDIGKRLSRFSLPANRLNFITAGGASFINDTYNANPLSLKLALELLGRIECCGRKIAVIGDMLELGKKERFFHSQAGRLAGRVCDYLICAGRRARFAALSAEREGLACDKIFACDNAAEAKEVLFGKIAPEAGDIVLVKGSRAMKMEGIFKR